MKSTESNETKLNGKVSIIELISYQQGAIVSRVIVQQPHGSVTVFAFDKDQEISEHTAPFDAMVQVLEGEALVTLGGKGHPLSGGEMIIMHANIPHAVKAASKMKMILIMIRE